VPSAGGSESTHQLTLRRWDDAGMTRVPGAAADATEPSMPDELSDAIARLGAVSAECARENWELIGDAGRKQYRDYLNAARTGRGRRQRCGLAALQLVNPSSGMELPPVSFDA
jgi:hypothetical protein